MKAVDPSRLAALRSDIARLRVLEEQEENTGRATIEQLALEDLMGFYYDILVAVADDE